jgi:hypothetical protein
MPLEGVLQTVRHAGRHELRESAKKLKQDLKKLEHGSVVLVFYWCLGGKARRGGVPCDETSFRPGGIALTERVLFARKNAVIRYSATGFVGDPRGQGPRARAVTSHGGPR